MRAAGTGYNDTCNARDHRLFQVIKEFVHLRRVANPAGSRSDNGANALWFAQIDMRELPPHVLFRFFRNQERHVTASKSPISQQIPASSRKSITLLQLLGLIGGAALIAAILLDHLV
ncbi:hypothetical protein [Paraburkholderia sp. SIMBA_030]|uniref:hypothetical protein n=1 Tax=Paraburkholderia sp. SIMBA_030 TaxID=3085773 RepID=UPI00397E30D6